MSTASHDGGVAASALGIMDDKAFAGPVQSNTAEHKSAQSNPPMTATGSKQPKGSVHFIAGGYVVQRERIVTSLLHDAAHSIHLLTLTLFSLCVSWRASASEECAVR